MPRVARAQKAYTGAMEPSSGNDGRFYAGKEHRIPGSGKKNDSGLFIQKRKVRNLS